MKFADSSPVSATFVILIRKLLGCIINIVYVGLSNCINKTDASEHLHMFCKLCMRSFSRQCI